MSLWEKTPSVDFLFRLSERTEIQADNFLNSYGASYKEVANDYPFPMFSSSPMNVFKNVRDLIKVLVEHSEAEYTIYWTRDCNKTPSEPEAIYLGFTSDGGIIGGISVTGSLFKNYHKALNDQYKEVAWGYELYPPSNIDEFRELINLNTL